MKNTIPWKYASSVRYFVFTFWLTTIGFNADIVNADPVEEKFPTIELNKDNVDALQLEQNHKSDQETENRASNEADQENNSQDEKLALPAQQSNDLSGLNDNLATEELQAIKADTKDKTHNLTLIGDRYTPEAVKRRAEETTDTYPRLIGETDLVIENNFLYEADDEEVEHDDWLVNIPVYSILEFTSRFNLESNLLFVLDGEDNAFRYYDGDYPFEGLYIKMLKLQYKADNFSIFGGRYEPAYEIFGYAPIFFGNYTTNLNLYGQVGGGISLTWSEPGIGKHTLTGHGFYLDTSRLSGEIINDRGRIELSDGGAGNTEELDNYLVTLNGSPIESISGVRYTLGYGKQIGNTIGLLDEKIRLASLLGVYQLQSEAELEFSVDLLQLINDNGLNEDNESITIGFGYSDWPTYFGIAYSKRFLEFKDTGDERTDRIAEVVWRYGLDDNSYLEGAFEWLEENGSRENAVGLAWKRSFDWPEL